VNSSGAESEPFSATASAPSRAVFISYASQDAAVANSIVESLEAQGLKCWLAPRDVKPGAQYADAIVRAINESRAVVLVMSGSAVDSAHVAREVERAASKRKPIIPFRIDTAALNPELEYFLSNSQWIDVPKLGMPAALAKLKEAVGQGSAFPSQEIAAGKHAGGSKKRIAIAATAVVVALGVAVGLGLYFWSSRHGAQAPSVAVITDKSIAVLPFVDMSEKKDQEYFADGMAEEIIDLLAKVPDLRVPARTSSFYFKGKSTKVPEIARELGVAQVLEGSIRRSGDRIRVTAQLVRADNGFHLWSETYDRDLSDVFKVQDDIANAVVQSLQISLMGGRLTRQKGGTQNLEAYQLFLRARADDLLNTKDGHESAREYLEQAIKLDPDFALAWAMLGYSIFQLSELGALPETEGFERARKLAQRAVQLSPEMAEAHTLLAEIHRAYDWDWAAAQAEARRALVLDPTNYFSLIIAGKVSATLGQWDDAEGHLREALVHDPLNSFVHWGLATTLYRAGRFADADAVYRKLIELTPGFVWVHAYLAKTLLAEGKPEAALAMARQEADEASRLDILPILLQATGRKAEAGEALNALTAKFANTDAYFIAMNYSYRDDRDLAFQWLDRAYNQKDIGFIEFVGEPLFKNIKGDPRYKAFLRKMNLPEG
jgi:TolB-like protein